MEDREFITIFNEYYPFERYIVKNPKSLNPTFDDLILMELFVPDTEIKPVLHNGHVVYFTNINPNEVYIKIKGKAGEMRITYYDLAEHIRDEIIEIILNDMGNYNWQSLYVQDEDEPINLVANLFGEYSFTESVAPYENRHTDYDALKEALLDLKACCENYNIKELGIPYKLGCGLAGGDWDGVVFPILQEIFNDNTVTLYIYKL